MNVIVGATDRAINGLSGKSGATSCPTQKRFPEFGLHSLRHLDVSLPELSAVSTLPQKLRPTSLTAFRANSTGIQSTWSWPGVAAGSSMRSGISRTLSVTKRAGSPLPRRGSSPPREHQQAAAGSQLPEGAPLRDDQSPPTFQKRRGHNSSRPAVLVASRSVKKLIRRPDGSTSGAHRAVRGSERARPPPRFPLTEKESRCLCPDDFSLHDNAFRNQPKRA